MGSSSSRQVENPRVLWRGKALYLGGHPGFLRKDKSAGDLCLSEEALEYKGREVTTTLRVTEITDASLGKYQPDMVKRLLVGDSRALADIRNILLLDFNYEGTPYRAEFQISGALTLPGTAEKAKEVLNALNSVRARFNQPSESSTQADESQKEPPELGPSAAARLRQAKQLLDEGLITEADYHEKKSDILRDV